MRKILLATALSLIAVPAFAQTYYGPQNGLNRGDYGPTYRTHDSYYDPEATGSIGPAPAYAHRGYASPAAGPGGYSFNPAADGNAEQQSKPVKNYGNVSGGPEAAGGW